MKLSVISVTALGTFVLLSCAGSSKMKIRSSEDCSAMLKQVVQSYDRGKYSDVILDTDLLKNSCAGHETMDSLHYYAGMSKLKTKNYVEARAEFERLVRDFPNSPLYENARYRIGYVVFKGGNPPDRDQSETKESIRILTDFIESAPKSEFVDSAKALLMQANDKLAEKEYRNALFYAKVNEKEAALIYYKDLISRFPQSRFSTIALYEMAQLYIALNRESEAKETLEKITEIGSDKAFQDKVKILKIKLGVVES